MNITTHESRETEQIWYIREKWERTKESDAFCNGIWQFKSVQDLIKWIEIQTVKNKS